ADTLHRHEIIWRRAAMSKSVKSGDSRAQQRAGFGIVKCVRYHRQCFDGSDHVLLIASVVADACNWGVATVEEPSTAAFNTGIVVPAMPADSDALSLSPSGDRGAERVDDAGNFVPGNPWILNSRPEPFFSKHIAV